MNYAYSLPIYVDVLSLLISDNGKSNEDLAREVLYQIEQGDPVWESILNDAKDNYPEELEEKVEDAMNGADFLKYVKVDRDGICVNYDETNALNNRRMVAFEIPFAFDFETFMKDHPELLMDAVEEER